MKKSSIRLTIAQFAKLHEVNKRTLHFYDEIQLFSPREKGENGYRYYDLSQSAEFEYIRMLKELNMNINEIRTYQKHPSPDLFLEIADMKLQEIHKKIKHLKRAQQILKRKKVQVEFCESLSQQDIQIMECKEERLLVLPYDFSDDDILHCFPLVKEAWSAEQIRMGIGGYISIDKVLMGDYEHYDGIFTSAIDSSNAKYIRKQKGRYLCGFQKGTWDELPKMYLKMIAYAKEHDITLCGYAFEMGLNEFVIDKEEDYMTQIMIKIKE